MTPQQFVDLLTEVALDAHFIDFAFDLATQGVECNIFEHDEIDSLQFNEFQMFIDELVENRFPDAVDKLTEVFWADFVDSDGRVGTLYNMVSGKISIPETV